MIAEIIAFAICSVIGRSVAHSAVSSMIASGAITSADFGATIVMVAAVVCGIIGVAVVHGFKELGKDKEEK